MSFWRVAGFSQPSPIEQILDKEDFTLEELLDEDDIVNECKSLNARLIAFLREKEVVEQLLKYLVQPPNDDDDPKRQYKYPFAACEVFCCEVEAIFNTLLDDAALLDLLFSILDSPPPLACKLAGYFARVAGALLLRKPNEMVQYLSNADGALEKLVGHLGVTSIAELLKRVAGADDQAAMIFMPMHTQWLVETPLLELLLERLGVGHSGDDAANAADILTAIAHTQPSALSSKLLQPSSIAALFKRALEPGGAALVPALEVCAALLEPRRGLPGDPSSAAAAAEPASPGGGIASGGAAASGGSEASFSGGNGGPGARARADALRAVLVYLPQLVSLLAVPADASATQETPYGLLAPPLGRARLKIVELLAVLLHVGDEDVDAALIASNALRLVMDLFQQYPFNNLLHTHASCMLAGLLRRGGPAVVDHALGPCRLPAWLAGLPVEVTPTPRPGAPPPKGALRAGYVGHVTRMANMLQEAATLRPALAEALGADEAWQRFVGGALSARNELEDVGSWECGRPAATEMGDLGSDDFHNDLDMEQMGLQPTLTHRYGALDDGDDDEDSSSGSGSGSPSAGGAPGGSGGSDPADFSGTGYGAMLATALQGMDINSGEGGSEGDRDGDREDAAEGEAAAGGSGGGEGDGAGTAGAVLADVVRERAAEDGGGGGGVQQGGAGPRSDSSPVGAGWSMLARGEVAGSGAPAEQGMEDDAVLLSTSDEEDALGPDSPSADAPAPPEAAPAAAEESAVAVAAPGASAGAAHPEASSPAPAGGSLSDDADTAAPAADAAGSSAAKSAPTRPAPEASNTGADGDDSSGSGDGDSPQVEAHLASAVALEKAAAATAADKLPSNHVAALAAPASASDDA